MVDPPGEPPPWHSSTPPDSPGLALHPAGAAGGGPGFLKSWWPVGTARGLFPDQTLSLSWELLHLYVPGDGGNAPIKGSPHTASPSRGCPQSLSQPAPAFLQHCPGGFYIHPVPADDFPLAQLRRRHVPHQVDEELPALLRDVGVRLLCGGQALSAGSLPGTQHPAPGPVPRPVGVTPVWWGAGSPSSPGTMPSRRAVCCRLPPLCPVPGRAPQHSPAILGTDRGQAARGKPGGGSHCSAELAPARALSAPRHCPALAESQHSPTSWAVQLNAATGGLVLASWLKPSGSAPAWQSPVPRSAAEGRGQGQRGTGAGGGAAPAEAGVCRREMLPGVPRGPLEPAARVWGTVLARARYAGARASSPPYGQGVGRGHPGFRQLPTGSEGLCGDRGVCPPHLWGAIAGATPLSPVAAVQPDGARAGRGSAGRGAALPESPSARHLPTPSADRHAPPPPLWPLARCLAHRSPTAQENHPVHIPPFAEGPRRGAAMPVAW